MIVRVGITGEMQRGGDSLPQAALMGMVVRVFVFMFMMMGMWVIMIMEMFMLVMMMGVFMLMIMGMWVIVRLVVNLRHDELPLLQHSSIRFSYILLR